MRGLLAILAIFLMSCKSAEPDRKSAGRDYFDRRDYHSYARPEEARVRHVALDLEVLFAERVLRGTATLGVDRARPDQAGSLLLDTRDLKIESAEWSADGVNFSTAGHRLGARDGILGSSLTVDLPPRATTARIRYATVPEASGLQWLTPAQTAGKKQPFLYSQSQAIHARSWVPLQDSPGVRVTYSAHIRTPKNLRAVMSARSDPARSGNGDYWFEMPQPVPSYLIALAVGDIDFRPLSARTGVYAEPSVVQKAAKEFEDTERMMGAAEKLYGPYRWDRYDILVLPPSFPYGGMENPRLTFVTPTLLAGDKSQVAVIAHELAHSWSGNLVTNATWRDFWLNEGFTTYFERRIQEEVFGPARSEMEAALERTGLEREMKDLEPRNQILYIDLKGRDPDEGFSQVPYVKGMLLLRRLEELAGRERWDSLLRAYFAQFAFQSIVTGDFIEYLRKNQPDVAQRVDVDAWLTQPGLPADAPRPKSDAIARVEQLGRDWIAGKRSLASMPAHSWVTHEWLAFLQALPEKVGADRMAQLDTAFQLTRTGNSEILEEWLRMAIRNQYQPAYPRLEQFLIEVGRRKYLKPLYTELAKTPAGKERARTIYKKARAGYHPISAAVVDEVLK